VLVISIQMAPTIKAAPKDSRWPNGSLVSNAAGDQAHQKEDGAKEEKLDKGPVEQGK
jgi:hypothetical protein